MTVAQRIQQDNDDVGTLTAFNDGGLFTTVYEKSAYVFHTRISKFKVMVRRVKALREPYLTLGFHTSQKTSLLSKVGTILSDGDCPTVKLFEPVDMDDYRQWRKEMLYLAGQKGSPGPAKDGETKTGTALQQQPAQQKERTAQFQKDTTQHYGELRQEVSEAAMYCVRKIRSMNIASMTPMEAISSLNEMQKVINSKMT